ncbi:MAG: glucokinase [Pseudomonadota bacterium]
MTMDLNMVVDVGGTNTRVGLAQGVDVQPDTIRRYRNDDYPGLYPVLERYRADVSAPAVKGVCTCLAGPVRDGVGALTNRDWSIDKAGLAHAANANHAAILNDLQAQGHAVGSLPPSSLTQIVAGPDMPQNAARLVVNVGTGFNAAVVLDTAHGTLVPPSECGHANLPIRTQAQLRLCKFIETAHGFPSVEDILSGRGLEQAYAWLSHEAGDHDQLSSQQIMAAIADGSNDRATQAGRVFVTILGTVAGNLSLIHLPFGGVYFVGGLARAFTPYLREFGMVDAFRDKGRFAGFMSNFGLHMVEDDYAALTGCATHLASAGA